MKKHTQATHLDVFSKGPVYAAQRVTAASASSQGAARLRLRDARESDDWLGFCPKIFNRQGNSESKPCDSGLWAGNCSDSALTHDAAGLAFQRGEPNSQSCTHTARHC